MRNNRLNILLHINYLCTLSSCVRSYLCRQTDLNLLINYITHTHTFFAVLIPFSWFYLKTNFTCIHFFSLSLSLSKFSFKRQPFYSLYLIFYVYFFSRRRMHSLSGAFSPTSTSSDTIKKLLCFHLARSLDRLPGFHRVRCDELRLLQDSRAESSTCRQRQRTECRLEYLNEGEAHG